MAELTFNALTKGRGAVLTGVSPAYAYVDGIKTESIRKIKYPMLADPTAYFRPKSTSRPV